MRAVSVFAVACLESEGGRLEVEVGGAAPRMTSRFGLGKLQQIRGVQPERRVPCRQSTRLASIKSLATDIHGERIQLSCIWMNTRAILIRQRVRSATLRT